MAAGGTVFLDEAGDLSLAGPAMLLRVLQEREVRAAGSTETLRGVLRRRDVAARFGIAGETARRELLTLTRLGLLRRAGYRRGARYLLP